jgi:hypothetical protein
VLLPGEDRSGVRRLDAVRGDAGRVSGLPVYGKNSSGRLRRNRRQKMRRRLDMRNAIAVLLVTNALCFASAASAQVSGGQVSSGQVDGAQASSAQFNYDLFSGYGEVRNYPPIVKYRAWVLSYKDSKYYSCVASYEFVRPATPALSCNLGGTFNPPLMSGATVKTIQAPGGPFAGAGTEEPQSDFFWQIDRATGQLQFCMPVPGVNCVGFLITDAKSPE